jgi:sugar lactone lactonase YvrE
MTKIAILLVVSAALFAGETRTWSQLDYADFEKGTAKNLSLRSDGLLTLAPNSRELFDASAAYLWAIAQDSKGNLYAGGADAKLYEIPPQGKARTVAELDAVEIHAIAVDSEDRVYAATSPDGKIYRVTGGGKPEVFYDPKAKYIWAMAFDAQGNLFVATGDHGEIHKVTPDGKGKVFYETGETHVRSMAVDGSGNLIVGTEPGGLVLRVSQTGEGFVLYQMAKREVTAVAMARDGSIYAAGVGSRQAGAAGSPAGAPQNTPAPAPPPAPAVVNPLTGAPAVPVAIRAAAPPAPAAMAAPAGGSEVVRIAPDGNPMKVWSNTQDVAYALGFDAAGRVLVGAGNKGNVYRIESPALYTALLTLPAAQVTALGAGRDGRLYAATGNSGKVFEIGPGIEHEGTIESDVFDATMFSLWGRLSFEATLHGGQVALSTRSGNLDSPQANWSPWSASITDAKGGRIASPAARFVQWKATLTAGGQESPELESVDVAYLPKNVEPRIDQIEFTPPNYKFPAPVAPLFQPRQTLSLPAMGAPAPHGGPVPQVEITPAMQAAKGFVGARWSAMDPNGDSMIYTLEIRGADESEWKPLAARVAERYYAWDSTAFPDGEYRLRITASDAPSNPPSEALTARMESDPFVIDNTPPKITALTAARSGRKLEVRWHAVDALNNIDEAEYSLDGGDWTVAIPVTKLSDSLELDYALSLDAAAGEHTVAVRVKDDYDNEAVEKVVARPRG